MIFYRRAKSGMLWENKACSVNVGELGPIGDALTDLPGPVQPIRDASPQALHHFTQADQVNLLVSASEADADLGFMTRTMALCSLPRLILATGFSTSASTAPSRST